MGLTECRKRKYGQNGEAESESLEHSDEILSPGNGRDLIGHTQKPQRAELRPGSALLLVLATQLRTYVWI